MAEEKIYKENTGKALVGQYNTAIDVLTSSAAELSKNTTDPVELAKKLESKVFQESGKIIDTASEGKAKNFDYLGRISIYGKRLEEMTQALIIYGKDRNSGLQLLSKASQQLHRHLVGTYVEGFVTQEKTEPKLSEEEKINKAIQQVYMNWAGLAPQEETE
jgi:hypothetical protein